MEAIGNIVNLDKQFVYSHDVFLRRVREELFRSNRRGVSFIWIEIPLVGFIYKGFTMRTPLRNSPSINGTDLEVWKVAVQTLLLNKSEIDVLGQGKNGLWILSPNKDFAFLEEKVEEIRENLKVAGIDDSNLKHLNFKIYFYSGKPQASAYEENRFIKEWNRTSKIFRVERISIKNTDTKNFKNFISNELKRFIDIVGGIFGIVVFSPVMLACAILVKIALRKWEKEQKKLGNIVLAEFILQFLQFILFLIRTRIHCAEFIATERSSVYAEPNLLK
ncbi:hypothetical protein AGMMS49938_11190 [Fibrobacterales bacterium]|nr:hypothetical protein AGMMS49938_11190 [Fibrobacterales bacterium]